MNETTSAEFLASIAHFSRSEQELYAAQWMAQARTHERSAKAAYARAQIILDALHQQDCDTYTEAFRTAMGSMEAA